MQTEQTTIIAIVGLTGSGKTDATERFISAGFARIGFNDRVYEELHRQGLERTEKNERMVREALRRDYGVGVMAERSLPKIEEAIKAGHAVVIESLYSWSEYKIMKKRFGAQFSVLAIYAPPALRYARLATRSVRSLSPDLAASRDYAEIEPPVEKAGPIAMADRTIQNLGTREDFLQAVDKFIEEILRRANLMK
ncbi:MAG: dephospho-CoA kinase [bacterium]|nr:dephospho-CoA kinase [bacterium]MDZ4299935.1 dephospho-CoA kinase [Candidatus Sungbacteria bacterium]